MKFSALLFVAGLLFTFSSYASVLPGDTLELAPAGDGDGKEYELIIFDTGFDSWFNRVNRPEWFYSEGYLENWNIQLVSQWNHLYHTEGGADCMPGVYVNYDGSVDYGKPLNYRLFYYFRYMHERCGLFSVHPGGW